MLEFFGINSIDDLVGSHDADGSKQVSLFADAELLALCRIGMLDYVPNQYLSIRHLNLPQNGHYWYNCKFLTDNLPFP